MIKELDLKTLKNIYYTHMTKDFPEDELKTFEMIEGSIKNGKSTALAYYQDSLILGYATILFIEDKLLLDYFAIIKDYRSKGYGKEFLKEIKEYFKDYSFILIESENINSVQAKRRIDFYHKCGCKDTNVYIRLYFVDYTLLYMYLSKSYDVSKIKDEVLDLYHKLYPEYLNSEYLIFYP